MSAVDVMAYYYPQWHRDPINDRLHRPGWTEWDLLEHATPQFPGHVPPGRPVAPALDESDPAVAAGKVDLARSAGITGFLVDWYWYEGGPFLNGFLDRGLLPALAGDRDFRFALMWANHPWMDLFPAARTAPPILLTGSASVYSFQAATDHILERYLTHPAYWTMDGRPYFCLYDIPTLLDGLGGRAGVRRQLQLFRDRAAGAGLDIHLNLAASRFTPDAAAVLASLGADSTTHYTWWHHDDNGFIQFPTTPYATVANRARDVWQSAPTTYDRPYLPNVTVGWDPSSRCEPWEHDHDRGYPYTSVMAERDPQLLEHALRDACAIAPRIGPGAVTINAWNEWTEGSYLEPDDSGTSWLDAVRRALTRVTSRAG